MTIVFQWFLVIAALPTGLLIKQICQRFNIPLFPWRILWIALLINITEHTLDAFRVPPLPGLDLNIVIGVFTAVAISRTLIWLLLELFPRLRLLPSSPKILRDLLFIISSGLLVAMTLQTQSNIDIVGLVTTSAVLTAVLGLAAQDPLKDLIGGLSLQLERVIQEGDWVEIEGHIGRVESISWRDTELNSLYGTRLIMPHANTNSKNIRNFTNNGIYASRITVGLDYDMPPHLAKLIMRRISDHHPLVLDKPTSIIRIASFEESSINYEWINWIQDFSQNRSLSGDLQEQLWYALQREGFSFPFSVRDIRLTRTISRKQSPQANKENLIETIFQLVRRNQLFSTLTDGQVSKMINLSSLYTYGPGEIIAVEGDSGESLFMLINGKVSIIKADMKAEATEIAELQSGDICGEMTVFTDAPRSATIRSNGKSDILEIHRQAIAELIDEEPILLERFSQLINDRQDQLNRVERQAAHVARKDVIARMKELFGKLLS